MRQHSETCADDPAAPGDGVIAGRYRIEAELGHGAVACVYRVIDERTGRREALKKLVASGEREATLKAMFEREYHALVQLAHPRIVRAFDYGVDGSPYYTMELLEGSDVRVALRAGTLTVHDVCVLLRDTASALALIHSRRMVHRDVSARNVWCTRERRGKLIDFGTLVAMGPQSRAAGTPPFMPPEALLLQPLDARCDIYALGALAYYLLTRRNAYAARDIADLRAAWQRPPERPHAIRTEVSPALSDLVMAMLSLDPRARPASAAEVFERLTAVADLSDEDERSVAQAFLSSPNLVGREAKCGLLRKRLLRAMRGRGSAITVVAPAGLGRSRMLASAMLDAKLLGAAAVGLDGGALGVAPLSLAGVLAERLLEAVPEAANQAGALAPLIGHMSPLVHRALGEPGLAAVPPLQRTRKLSVALVDWIGAISREHALMVAVDDVHRVDGASLGVLGRLAVLAPDRRLVLVTSCDEGAVAQVPPSLAQLVQASSRLELAPLGKEDTRALLASLFGAVPRLDETASWLHELSQGSPQACMHYAQYLLDRGLARYEGGKWQLPAQLRDASLPESLQAMLEDRLRSLGDDARSLALGLALARDESRSSWQPEIHVRIEDFPKLLDTSDAARTFAALDELVRAGIVQQRDSYYVLAQRALADALLRLTDAEARRCMHARLAAVFEQDAPGRMLPVRQLQLAGEHRRARAALVVGSTQLGRGPMDWGAMRVSVSAACGRSALSHWEAEPGPPREGILLRRLLLMICPVYDWSLAWFGDAQLARLRADSGLVHWDQTDPGLPAEQRVRACLDRAQLAYDASPDEERGFAPDEALNDLIASTITLSTSYANAHDVARARALPAVLQPLCAQSPLAALLAELCDYAIARATGRELGDRALSGIQRLFGSSGLPDVLRLGRMLVEIHTQAVFDARRGHPRALQLMDGLAATAGDDLFLVAHGRWLGHAFRGDAAAAERFRKQSELITEDDAWRRKAFLFVEAELYALTGDVLGLGRASAEIAALAETFPGWRPWLSWTRAQIERMHGRLDAAQAELDAALSEARAGEHRVWLLAAPGRAELLLIRGDAAGAAREAEAIAQQVVSLSLEVTAAIAADRVRALAESRLGRPDAARAVVAQAFARAAEIGCGGLQLAILHEASARIALEAGDAQGCAAALAALRTLLEHADAQALINQYEALRDASSARFAEGGLPAAVTGDRASPSQTASALTQVRAYLLTLNSKVDRARRALEMLLQDSGATSAHLVLFDDTDVFVAASIQAPEPGDRLLAAVRGYLEAELHETRTAVATIADLGRADASLPDTVEEGGTRFQPVLLTERSEERTVVAGLALFAAPGARTPDKELVRAIARCLLEMGDSVPRTAEG